MKYNFTQYMFTRQSNGQVAVDVGVANVGVVGWELGVGLELESWMELGWELELRLFELL